MNKNVKLDKQIEMSAEVHSLSHEGLGIATVNHKTTFIAGALPGETVTFRITKKRSNYHEGDTVAVIKEAPERDPAPCKHFGICGGCSLQHMNMATQIALKQKTLLEQLKHFGKVTSEDILPTLNATTLGYRRKARLGVKFVIKKNKLLVGFREKASRYLADIESCAVLHPRVGESLVALQEVIASLLQYQHIAQIEVAMGDNDVALIFRHLQPLSTSDIEKLIAFCERHQFHLYLQPNPPEPVTKIWSPDVNSQFSRLRYSLPDHQLEFLFHPLDFTQINLEMNRMMINQAITLLDLEPNDRVLDLFCGIGNFTLPIAKKVTSVLGIEGSDEMVNRAYENAKHNHISNVEFKVMNLQQADLKIDWRQNQFDKILLDPPRTGAKEIIPALSVLNAKRIVYVSCNPATLARDAGELVNILGYRLKKVGIMNMFPHTSHIEAMAVFDK